MHSLFGRLEVPVDIYFRDADSFPDIEYYALSLCHGKVLDIGAGTGCHTKYLQDQGMDVTALDCTSGATAAMKYNGVRQILEQDVFTLTNAQFDTLLMLMNGIGFVGDLAGFRKWLRHARSLLAPGGAMVFDTSDIRVEIPDAEIRNNTPSYWGTVWYELEYKGELGRPFPWLYLDQRTIMVEAEKADWQLQIVFEDHDGHYLVMMHPMD